MKRLVLLASLLACAVTIRAAAPAKPIDGAQPNIIFILTDDQGYGDISAHGNPVLKTPHLAHALRPVHRPP